MNQNALEPRFVIFHIPGPLWKIGVNVLDQPGVAEHVQYLQSLLAQGKVEFGGPFLSESAGGMLILRTSQTLEMAEAIAQTDPAVKSGLIRFEIRPWLITLRST